MEIIVEKENVNNRLDIFLSNKLGDDYTRSYIKTLIENGNILVNNNKVKSGYSLKLNDIILLKDIVKKDIDIIPKKMDINIIYEDNDVIVINKDKGVVVHPGNNNYTDTLVNGLLYSHKDSFTGINDVIRPGIVHRIDKDTTGVIVVCKNDKSLNNLANQFKEHSITRKYVALCKGIIKDDEITIDKPIGRDPKNRLKMAVTDRNSKRAVTHIKVLKRYYNSKITLIEAKLETGRTHQIRVHMKSIGYPLLGDLTYGNEYPLFKCSGHMLHAKVLGFVHPTLNKYIEFETDLPNEFKDIISKLEKRENTSN